jgi:hypothetical protein
MSEHRLPHRLPTSDKRWLLTRLLQQKHCQPDCTCIRRLTFYQEKFLRGEDEQWTIAQLATAETLIFSALCCVRDNSSDPAVRRYSTIQLMKPFWDRQRAGKELTDA